MSSAEFHTRLFDGWDDVEVRRNEGHTWLEHLALSLFHFQANRPVKGIKHGLYACAGFGSCIQGLSRVLGATTVVVDRELLIRAMQAFLDEEGKAFTVNPDTDFEMFETMASAFMADALPPLKAFDSGDLELTATLFSQNVEAIPEGMGFVYLPKPKAKGGIDLDIVKPKLWRRLFRGDVIGRDVDRKAMWIAAVDHMKGRVASAAHIADRYVDRLAASLEHLEDKAPAARKKDFAALAAELASDREVRKAGGPWGSSIG